MLLIISDDETIDICKAVIDYYSIHNKLDRNRWPTKKGDIYSTDKNVNKLINKLVTKTMKIYNKKGIVKNK